MRYLWVGVGGALGSMARYAIGLRVDQSSFPWATLGISAPIFLEQLRGAITSWTLWVGVIKAPVFAAIIAMVGCYEGFNVSGSAESVGRLTTQSVVEAIFLVIVADAAFSVLFSILQI